INRQVNNFGGTAQSLGRSRWPQKITRTSKLSPSNKYKPGPSSNFSPLFSMSSSPQYVKRDLIFEGDSGSEKSISRPRKVGGRQITARSENFEPLISIFMAVVHVGTALPAEHPILPPELPVDFQLVYGGLQNPHLDSTGRAAIRGFLRFFSGDRSRRFNMGKLGHEKIMRIVLSRTKKKKRNLSK
ncbi:mitochondrial distribution and morphology protein 34 1, partial [Striga asiatica]